MLGPALPLNFDEPPSPPDWLVEGLIERETVTVMSADSGVGKSIICNGLTVNMIQGKPWLGRDTHGERVVIIDEENFARVIRRRLQAFGMTNADRANVLYFNRIGTSLGEDDWFSRTEATLQKFQPDLLIIDTAAAATCVDVNDNTAVARFYSQVLRPLAYYCAVILLHHERKPATGAAGGKRHAGHAMMGARQWAGQSDAHIALEVMGEFEEMEQDDGTLLQRHPIKLEMPKSRDGASKSALTHFAVTSLKESDGETLRWLRLEVDHAPRDASAQRQAEWADKVEGIIRDLGGSATKTQIADALGVPDPNSGALARGLRRMHDDGRISRPEHGVYALPPVGGEFGF